MIGGKIRFALNRNFLQRGEQSMKAKRAKGKRPLMGERVEVRLLGKVTGFDLHGVVYVKAVIRKDDHREFGEIVCWEHEVRPARRKGGKR